MFEFANSVIAMLRVSPGGLTAKDIAERLGTTAGNISSRLSKLAAYGIIGKARDASVRPGLRGTLYQAHSDDALLQRSSRLLKFAFWRPLSGFRNRWVAFLGFRE
jgi:DNA-binding transcriptional regulator GbsR (MarR family)